MQSLEPPSSPRDERDDVALYPKEAIAATFLKIDRFNDRLGAIRRQLAARRDDALRPLAPPGHIPSRNNASDVLPDERDDATYEPIRLPRLANVPTPVRATEPSFDGRELAMDALRSRELSKAQYEAAWTRLQRAEEAAAASVQEADRLTEDARIALVLYSKNERSWPFDERARRYQEVMQTKKEAEGARLKADDDRVLVQCLRSQLVDPYLTFRTRNATNSPRQSPSVLRPLSSSNPSQETVLVWILASPLLTLPFTPRDVTPSAIVAGEKELSTHVVYYAATSTTPASLDGTWSCGDDKPPSEGWLCCSNHGVMPPPSVTPVKASIETWLVSGAGSAHLNGKYLFSGTHNGTRKFKSTNGVELFRKELPKTSSIIRGVDDSVMEKDDEATTSRPGSLSKNDPLQLPSTLRTLEKDASDFKSMEKIGAWMSTDTILQKRRRLRDVELNQNARNQDGNRVLTQETSSQRRDPSVVTLSRPEASAELCREWVLFMRCSRRVDQLLSDAPKRAIGLGCLKRHYYISVNEKETMITWAHEQEAWLEKDVLTAIIRREAYVERVSRTCQKCMSKFQQDLREETESAVKKILRELNTIRFLTVKVLEAIEAWRSHARRRGYSRYDGDGEGESSKVTTLGWSASITVGTGKKLFKGAHAFVSKFKRFCRPEDPNGQEEKRLVYLGYFATRDEAEVAYDVFANAEARRLNTTVAHLPQRRNVFRSCGKHFSVESERLGPDYCIECAGKQISTEGAATNGASSDDWNPPFFFPAGQNYILKLAADLDFLDNIPPLKNRLNANQSNAQDSLGIGVFPLLGNVFLLPRTPIEDPELTFFASLKGSGSIPPLRGRGNQEEEDDEVLEEALEADRVVKAQHIFLHEMQIYHPEQFQRQPSSGESNQLEERRLPTQRKENSENPRRIVQALYWDRCAALRIEQERAPIPFRQQSVWCRPDAGEWASLLVRGKHQQHFVFENRLAKTGKENQERRKKTLKIIRKLLKTPIYLIPSRDIICSVIAEGEHVKGDVVLLEVKSAYKFLDKYDAWCKKALHVQRWYRGVRARRRARAVRRALHVATIARRRYMNTVSKISAEFYTETVVPSALKSAARKLRRPAYSRSVKVDGELLIVGIYATNSVTPVGSHLPRTTICRGCARQFHVSAHFSARTNAFHVVPRACCCLLNSPLKNHAESWVLRAYNPLSNVVYRLVLQNKLLTQLLQSLNISLDGYGKDNPLYHYASLSRAVKDATSVGNYVDRLAAKAFEEWTNWRILSDEAIQRRKIAEVDLERARERVVDLVKRFDFAIGAARRALDFTSVPFEKAQAWDPLENANDWRLLVQKRHTQKELASAIDEADQCRFELFQAKASESYLRDESTQHRVSYETYWKPLVEKHQAAINALTIEKEASQAVVVRAMSWVCTVHLALRDTFYAPTRRALVIAPAIWHRTDKAMDRLLMASLPGLQRARNTLHRQVIKLTDLDKSESRRCTRLIVDVSAWTTTPNAGLCATRSIWVSAYNPRTAHTQRVYLDWELVQLLATPGAVRPSQVSERERWLRIANKLLSLCMLDRFTGEFTLRKLQFYHHLRLLRPQFLASRWFQDLKRGRKCGDGDEIFRQSFTIDGKLCFVVVYENWGDLMVCAFRSTSAKSYGVRIPIAEVFSLLVQKPLALHLWICCVKSNQYGAAIITTILSFLRFTESDDELVITNHENGGSVGSSVKLICVATKIQQRAVLLQFRDALGGDLEIHAYDMTHNQTFQLRLEWESIRRVLRTSEAANPSSRVPRRRNLTLARNRRELCGWIASRLHFQSLLDHPDQLASSFSPLISGIQVRTSFRLFNEWISNSIRNPLCEVPESMIDKLSATADAILFRGLTHEQLAFIAQERVPCSYGKEFIATRDFIVKGLAGSEIGLSGRHLKVDLYLKTHHAYARVRHEMEQEMISRHERYERQLMDKEEELAVRQEILSASDTASRRLTHCSASLRMASLCITVRLTKNETLFDELSTRAAKRAMAQGKKKPIVRKRKAIVGAGVDHHVDPRSIVSGLLVSMDHQNGNAVHSILAQQSFGLNGTLHTLLHDLEQAEKHVTDSLLADLNQRHEQGIEMIQQNSPLDKLHASRSDLLRFLHSVLVDEQKQNDVESSVNDKPEMPIPASPPDELLSCVTRTSSKPLSAYILQPTGTTEEILIESRLLSAQPLSTMSSVVSNELLPLFPRSVRGRKLSSANQLHTKRVPLGLVVFDKTQSSIRSCQWNARATALAMEPVAGLAVFIPSTEFERRCIFHEVDALFLSLAPFEPNDTLKKPRPSSGAVAVARRRTVQRSKQLLPWKQLSIERMQTARRFRQQRMHLGLLFSSIEEERERENRTLGVLMTSLHHLEWMLGGTASTGQLDTDVVTGWVESLRLQKCNRRTLMLERENRMLHLFDETLQAQLVPTELPTSDLRFGHVSVEADDWERPRRLIFSCQELQSRQRYSADCSMPQLQHLLAQEKGQDMVHWPIVRPPVELSRAVALAVAKKLVFKRKNGTFGLHFVESTIADQPLETSQKVVGSAEAASQAQPPVFQSSRGYAEDTREVSQAMTPRLRVSGYELTSAEHRCRSRRFLKHQCLIRKTTVAKQLEATAALMAARQLPREWLRMTQEDWSSQEHRGILTLEGKDIKKLRQAYTRVHQHRLGDHKHSIDATGIADVGQWLMEMDKEMGVKSNAAEGGAAVYQREAERFVSSMEQKSTWWREKHPKDEPLTLDVADVAEWWRQRKHHTTDNTRASHTAATGS